MPVVENSARLSVLETVDFSNDQSLIAEFWWHFFPTQECNEYPCTAVALQKGHLSLPLGRLIAIPLTKMTHFTEGDRDRSVEAQKREGEYTYYGSGL